MNLEKILKEYLDVHSEFKEFLNQLSPIRIIEGGTMTYEGFDVHIEMKRKFFVNHLHMAIFYSTDRTIFDGWKYRFYGIEDDEKFSKFCDPMWLYKPVDYKHLEIMFNNMVPVTNAEGTSLNQGILESLKTLRYIYETNRLRWIKEECEFIDIVKLLKGEVV